MSGRGDSRSWGSVSHDGSTATASGPSRSDAAAARSSASRSVAVDMESATIAANGFRYRVPNATLLCVSDKPLHGEIKLPGAANAFYERAVGEHLLIGLDALDRLRRDRAGLHSRKLRAFDEPPFR